MSDAPTPQDEARYAAHALASRDLVAAVHHLAGALSVHPHDPEILAVCDAVFESADDAVALTAPDDRPWYGNLAVHARALARDARHTEAIHLLLQVAAVRPEVGYLGWAVDWLDAPATAVDPDALAPAFSHYLTRVQADPRGAAAALPLLDRLVGYTCPPLAALRAHLLWRLRDPRALDAARDADLAHPDGASIALVGMVLVERGDVPGAVSALEEALRRGVPRPDEVEMYLADLLCGLERFAEGLDRYERVIARTPGHLDAEGSACFYRWILRGDAADAARLAALADAHPDAARLRRLRALCGSPTDAG